MNDADRPELIKDIEKQASDLIDAIETLHYDNHNLTSKFYKDLFTNINEELYHLLKCFDEIKTLNDLSKGD